MEAMQSFLAGSWGFLLVSRMLDLLSMLSMASSHKRKQDPVIFLGAGNYFS